MVFANSLCRICARIGAKSCSIFEPGIELKLNRCFSITLSREDLKPKEICDLCHSKINEFFAFIQLFYASNEMFEKSLLQSQFNGVIVNTDKSTFSPEGVQNQTVLRHSSDYPSFRLPKNKDTPLWMRKKFVCQHCGKLFTRRNSLNIHLSLHSNVKPFSCEVCTKVFANERHYKAHKVIHTNKYQCQICLKSFSVPSKHQRHLRTHTQQKSFFCSEAGCGKSFVDKSNLKNHELTHSNVKLFECNVCRKNYRTNGQLRDHMKTHDSMMSFDCGFCGKKYKWKSNFSAHMKKFNGCCGDGSKLA